MVHWLGAIIVREDTQAGTPVKQEEVEGLGKVRVILYRDGVSEGQFDSVLQIELSAMQRACSNLRPDYEPRITFIVVQKRHHIRLNPVEEGRNVSPGTVVDTEITHHREFDFYLCSQEGIQTRQRWWWWW
ncbi:unnamed protein product [Hydatigera taeniaeformis]|uniref:Piwi domain-containing protein n=1 Tax=Hydatigena taeniaeformis TaxID=6205 RepID=A0A0R3WNM2_HYDTA|nr:unnamed protein product [Hydatigera taeniaeformis]